VSSTTAVPSASCGRHASSRQAFRSYEHRAGASDALDEHRLRELTAGDLHCVARQSRHRHGSRLDRGPCGPLRGDFDLLNRLPNLAAIDIVSTDGALASGFHERLHNWWPGNRGDCVCRSAAIGSTNQADPHGARAHSRRLSALVHASRP
jgi:hypothetical protein